MSEEENFKQQLAKLREEFRASLTSRIDQIVAAVDHLAGAADTGIEFEPVFRKYTRLQVPRAHLVFIVSAIRPGSWS